LIWAVPKCNRSVKFLRPQNKAQNRPAQRRLLNLKWFRERAAAYVLHYAPGITDERVPKLRIVRPHLASVDGLPHVAEGARAA
jgi:hypothetical protein